MEPRITTTPFLKSRSTTLRHYYDSEIRQPRNYCLFFGPKGSRISEVPLYLFAFSNCTL